MNSAQHDESAVNARLLAVEPGYRAVTYGLLAGVAATIGWLYAGEFRSMAYVWMQSRTFAHGFLIAPMSAYVLWIRRAELCTVPLRPSLAGLLCVLVTAGLWLVSVSASIQVGEQFAAVGMLLAAVWCLCGTAFVLRFRFPLLFAFFAIPFGEFLIPTLMDWTAIFTVTAVRLTGIPVHLEGNFFTLPSGNFEVAAACSGIRFLLVTLVLSIYFAYFSFARVTRRLAFVAAVAGAMILANGIRAYLIVLLVHYSNKKFGTGMEHIYLGWLVFALVFMVMFWIGGRYADRHDVRQAVPGRGAGEGGRRAPHLSVPVIFFLSAQLIIVGAQLLHAAAVDAASTYDYAPLLPPAKSGWHGPGPTLSGYAPHYDNASYISAGRYDSNAGAVEVHIIFFNEQVQGSELVNWRNTLFDDATWRAAGRPEASNVDIGEQFAPNGLLLTNGRDYVLLWYWYDIGGSIAGHPVEAKILRARNLLSGRDRGDALVVVAAPVPAAGVDAAADRLGDFLESHGASLRSCLRPRDAAVPCVETASR